MCGIFSSINIKHTDDSCISIVNHRGPDYQSFIRLDNSTYMGHARLSILDLDKRSHQPFFDETKRYAIAYNGEIYNYIEIRQELKKKGIRFDTTSDTEVVLKSFMYHGVSCLDMFNGMFAFVIYDKIDKKIFAARDRFGIKPLYIFQKGDKVAFASEIKQFISIDGFKAIGNSARIKDFVNWRIFDHTNETLFNNVYQLRGGQYLYINSENLSDNILNHIHTWYSYENLKNLNYLNESPTKIFEKFFNVFEDSVRLRLRSDVPVSTALSGGLDSSSLACIVDKIDNTPQTFFNCYNNEEAFDEYKFAKAVADKTNNNGLHKVPISHSNLFERIQKIIWHNDEPIASNSILSQSYLFQLINEKGFKVTLNGQGADESLGIYGRYNSYINEHIKKIKLRKAYEESFKIFRRQDYSNVISLLKAVKMLYNFTNPYLYSNHYRNVFNEKKIENNPHNYLSKEMGLTPKNNLRDYNILILMKTSLPMLLHYDDRNSMTYSVESRVPFLDYRLVEYVMRIPSDLKVKDGQSKYVLRESLKSILPRDIFNRKTKLGFAVPQNKWLLDEKHKDQILNRLNSLKNYNLFDSGKIDYVFFNLQNNQDYSLIWRLIMLENWLSVYNVQSIK